MEKNEQREMEMLISDQEQAAMSAEKLGNSRDSQYIRYEPRRTKKRYG